MQKIPTLFVRDMNTRLVTPEITHGCEWVVNGEGVATEKFDGTCCLVRNGALYRRYDARPNKALPENFEPAQPNPDPITGHWPGWVPVSDDPADQYHRSAWANFGGSVLSTWTYELVGPMVQGNPHALSENSLWRHGRVTFVAPRHFTELREWLATAPLEGVVWWRDLADRNCEKVKIKRRDFGLPWPI